MTLPQFLSTIQSWLRTHTPPPTSPHIPTRDDLVSYYFPLLLILIIFWPIIVTIIITITSTSSWIFWIITSSIFGVIQLMFVVYQFAMINLDLVGLSLMKTYTFFRSRVRYYTDVLGLNKWRSRKRRGRREWREQMNKASTFQEFCNIVIEEPEDRDAPEVKKESFWSMLHDWVKGGHPKKTETREPPRRSYSEAPDAPITPPKKSNIKKTQSCLDFQSYHDADIGAGSTHAAEPQDKPTITHSKSQHSLLPKNPTSTDPETRLGGMLHTTTQRIREARIQSSSDTSSLQFLLSGVVKRNHLGVDDFLLEDARSIAECGQHTLHPEFRSILEGFMKEVETSLEFISEGDALPLLLKLKQNTGCTALMLSGGGAQTMHQLGIIRALIESGAYHQIPVVSGTSGGSIGAALCAVNTPEELWKGVCVPWVSTDYRLNGDMKRYNIRWFPKMWEMGAYWLKKKLLVDSKDFKRCCDFYYGDITFEEAFHKTGKHVCITVSASRSSGGSVQRLMLNHISTPHITLSSAVACSCAVPGVMAPAKLETKDRKGNIEPFEVDGVEWIDGSIQADLPFHRISTLFNVSNYIVCQVNFHIVPLINKVHHPDTKSLYWKLFQYFEWDIRSRVLNLSRLGLFPKLFGQDVAKIFKQKYHGNLTIVPRFTRTQMFGMQVLVNPSVEDMEVYLKNGQAVTWPYITVINQMLRLESAIDKAISKLQTRANHNTSPPSTPNSITKSIHLTITNNHSMSEELILEQKVKLLEAEVNFLRKKVHFLESEEHEEKKEVFRIPEEEDEDHEDWMEVKQRS